MKKLLCTILALLTALTFSGCKSENNAELPRITLVKYHADYNDYPGGVFDRNKEVHEIIVYTDDGKIYSAAFEGREYQDDPAWISPGSDDWYERLTELAEGEPSGMVPEERQKLIRDNYKSFSKWARLATEECGTIFDYMDATDLYVVFEDSGETRVEKPAELSCSPNCRDSAAARKFAGAFLGSPFPSDN